MTVPVYLVIVSSYGLGNERMPATSALSCKATVEAMRGWAAAAAGAGLAALARKRFGDRGFDQPSLLAVASGGMAGESIIGVVIAILIAIGLL